MRSTTAVLAIGTSLSLAAFGASAAEIALGHAEHPHKGSEAPTSETVSSDRSIETNQLSGALSKYSLPKYDGPVPWGLPNRVWSTNSIVGVTVLTTTIGALGGMLISETENFDRKKYLATTLLGAAILGTGSWYTMTNEAKKELSVKFPTTITEVISATPAFYTLVKSGKSTHEVGPIFPQIVNIPECSISLAAGRKDAPLIPGERIIATFRVDSQSGAIKAWSAEPAPR